MMELFLGLVQGITEFLPISSSGHLVVLSNILNLENYGTEKITFLHLGTLFSILIYFFNDLIGIVKKSSSFFKYLKLILVGIIPAGIVGLTLPIEKVIDSSQYILLITGASYLFLSVLLNKTDLILEGQLKIEDLDLKKSFLIGIAQSIALLPGISRSGITIATGVFLKLKKNEAVFFSMLLGIPTIFGAWLFTFVRNPIQIGVESIGPFLVAFISGLVAIKILLQFTVNSKLKIFSYYCFAFGIISIVSYFI